MRAVTLRTCEIGLSYIAALALALAGCEKSDCAKIWEAQSALRKFGCEQAAKAKATDCAYDPAVQRFTCKDTTKSCADESSESKRERFMSQCSRWPTDVRHCLADDDPNDSKCRAIIDRCLANPACEKTVNGY